VRRSLAAAAILVVPVALTIHSTVRGDVNAIRAHSKLTAVQANVVPPFAFPGYGNVPLLLGIQRHVPADASIGFVSREPAGIYLRTGWIRWLAFAVAPRLVVDNPHSRWVVYARRQPPAGAAHVWRFGDDRLVER
jgi:hypothetical protein